MNTSQQTNGKLREEPSIIQLLESTMPNPPSADTRTRAEAPDEEAWELEAIVLLVERRRCKCGRTHSVPNPALMTRRRKRTFTRFRQMRMDKLAPETILPYDIPHEIVHIDTRASACERCFRKYLPNGQGELFPKPKPPPIAERKMAKIAPIFTPLSEF